MIQNLGITKQQFRKLPYAVVDLAISQGWTKELAYYLHITSLFGNGIIYDYSTRTLADKLGISKSAVSKNVNFLLEVGLLKLVGKNLVGTPLKDLRNWYVSQTGDSCGKGLITVKLQKTVKYTEWNLFARVPLNCINRQKYVSLKRAEVNAIRAKVNSGSYISSKEYKSMRAKVTSFETTQTENAKKSFTSNVYFMSDKYLSNETGKSVGTVRSMIKFWIDEGIVTSTFHKGQCLDTHFNARAYEAIKIERQSDYSSTYLYKGRIMTYNRRSLMFGEVTRVYKEVYFN